jgi:hypothetical protein
MTISPDGIQAWPTSPDVLADTHKCPGCFTPVTRPVCPVCGFVLTDPRALDVLALGRGIISYEAERQRLIEEVRLAYHGLPVSEPAPAPAPPPLTRPEPEPALETAAPAAPTPWWVDAPTPPATSDTLPPLTAHSPTTREPAAGATVADAEPVIAPETDAPKAPALEPEPAAAVAASAAAAGPTFAPAGRPPREGPPAPEPRAPRRLSVPVLLLIVGVSLVGVAAIFFLVYAWFTWGIAVRALIIGAITIATIAIASLLRRRSLTATAEGIAVLGVVLLGLDAWAVRANDFFGTGQMSGTLYAGFGILVVGVVCRVWAKLSRLRSPDIAAVLALPIGLGLLVAGLTSLPVGESIVAGLIGASVGGLVHALPAPWSAARARADAVPEHVTLAAIGVASLVGAAVVATYVSLDTIPLPLWSGGAIIVLGAAHTALLRPRPAAEPLPGAVVLAAVASSTAAAVATVLGWQLAVRSDLPVYPLLVAPVVAVAVPVLLDRVRDRVRGLDAATITATALGVLSLATTLVWWGLLAAGAVSSGWIPWQTAALSAPAAQADGAVFAAIAGVLIAALLFVAPTLGRPGLRTARTIVASIVLLIGVAVLAVPALLVGAAVLVAGVATAVLRRPTLRAGAAGAAAIGAFTAFVAGSATPWLWLIAVAVAIAVPITAQLIVRPAGPAAAGLTFAPIGVATVAALLAPAALGAVLGEPANPTVTVVLFQWIALIALVCAVVLPGAPASRTTLAVSGYVLFALSLAQHALDGYVAFLGILTPPAEIPTALGEPALAVVRSVALLAVVTAIALGRTRVAAAPALAAAVLVAPVASTAIFALVRVLGLEDEGAVPLATVGAAATVVWVAAVWSMLRPSPAPPAERMPPADATPEARTPSRPGTRAVVDLGALVTTIVLAWDVSEDLRWIMLIVVAMGVVGASISRGWAAPASERTVGIPSTRAVGVETTAAPRRLLAWPAFALATAALWDGLWTTPNSAAFTVESYALPPAVALLAFAAVLVWLRRHDEAALALAASFLLGLAVPAVAGWSGSPVRGTVVALVASAVVLLLTWTPALRARIPALAGATTAVLALALVTTERAIDDAPAGTGWLLLLVGVAFASALGASRPFRDGGRRSWYTTIAPPIVLVAAGAAGILSAHHTSVLAVALAVLAALHVASAAFARDPFGSATRWTALAIAGAFAVAGYFGGATVIDGTALVEPVSVPLALIVLAGSALAQLRRHRDGLPKSDAELTVWLCGVVVAVVPSIVAPVEALRTWLVIVATLTAALIAVFTPLRGLRTLRISSAALLTAGALAMGVRAVAAQDADFAEAAAIIAGAGALLVAAAMIFTAASRPIVIATVIAGAGAALLVTTVMVYGDGALDRATLTAIIAATAAVGGAALLGLQTWRGFGAVLAVAGLVGAIVAIAARFIVVAGSADTSIEPDLWAVIAVAVIGAVGIMALRATAGMPVARLVATAVGVAFAVALVLFTVAELMLLAFASVDELRPAITMSALSIAGFGGVVWRPRLGLTPPVTAVIAAVAFGVSALLVYGVSPVELVTVPPALAATALGVRALRRNPQARSWPALGPGLALLTLPSLAYDFFGDVELWRVVALGIVALVLVVVGAILRLQAPLLLGSVVLLVHGASQLWPWISAAYEYVPWWLWLGIGGVLLIYLAARYEKNMRAVRTAFTAVTSLR